MTTELTFWTLGCAFGLLAGWLITWTYYTHKIRKIKNWIGWKGFHQQLDTAMAIWISEGGNSRTRLPSQTTLMEFMEYSYEKTRKE